jgi:hypothetical protein
VLIRRPIGRLALLVVGLLGTVAGRARAQEARARFAVDSVGDSTFTFAVGRARWVSRGQHGLTVDPVRDDALIARFRVLRVDSGVATVVITGQTARVARGQIALLSPPGQPFYAQPAFWIALAAGGAIGYFAHTH